MAITFNYNNNEIVSSSTVIVSGRTATGIDQGVIEFVNNDNKVFPPQSFEVNGNGNFKAIIHVSPGEDNKFKVNVMDNGMINNFGFPQYNGKPRVLDSGELTLKYVPLESNKPVHLCIIMGRDSNGSYDMPRYRLSRGEVANLDTAIKKLKVAGRLMQAYTQDEMRSTGFSNRSFQFVEERSNFQGIFGYNVNSSVSHQEIKVHVLKSPKTVAELRDPNLAQQNPKGSNTGGLFSHALELIKNTPELFEKRKMINTSIQCAVIYLDAHFDVAKDMILTHAALGGGNGDIKLAIFGSHGLHSWPINFPMMTPSFLDATHLSKREVANDANQCGTSWECLNITLGAFMHEIGHLLTCPHQVSGVMLRDYIWWNRGFMTREFECLRTGTRYAVINPNGTWPKVCNWNILDKIRFLFHGCYALPIDDNDRSFGHIYNTTLLNDDSYGELNKAPTLYNTPSGCLVKSEAGIFLIEVITKDLARFHLQYLPNSYGGQGLIHETKLDYQYLYDQLKAHSKEVNENYDVRVLSLGGDLFIKNFKDHCKNNANIIRSDFGLGKGKLTGFKSALLGRAKGDEVIIGFDIHNIYKIRVYHGGALDGIRIYFDRKGDSKSDNSKPPVPPRNYMSRLIHKVADHSISDGDSSPSGGKTSVLLGNEKHHYTDVNVTPGDTITKLNFRNGAWMDAVQFEFSSGKKTAMMGNANGGHLSTLEAPTNSYTIVGLYGYTGNWLDGLGIIYTSDL